jgi:glycosyltransferase involved in cell wall biosynthesis
MAESLLKVLWFSNTPANGIEILKDYGVRGGWLSALDRSLNGKVKLTVTFNSARYIEPFHHKGVMYLPICNKHWKLNVIKKNLFNDMVEKEELKIYLDIIQKVQPDVIHIHGTENPFGCIMGVVDLPIVLSYQGSCTVYDHKYFSGIEKKYTSFKKTTLWPPYSWIFSKSYYQDYKNYSVPTAKREQKNLKNCKIIIGRTDWDRRITRILAPHSIYYHNDEILRESFYQYEWKCPNNKKTVIHSTNGYALFKGFETICQSIYELTKIGIDVEWRIAGVSKNSLLDTIVKRKLKKSYPTKGLFLMGDLNEKELVEKMLESDIFVMPSHIENSPNSLCEAMILGMPCITTLAGGSSSLLKDKVEGLVIQDGDPWSMAGAIIEMKQNPEIAFNYGQNARLRALDRHNPDKIVNDLLDIYQKAANKNDFDNI